MLTIREASKDDRVVVAEHLRHIALEVGFSEDSIYPDWLEKTIRFIDRARRELRYKGFIAQIDGKIVGSVSCQVLELYPMVSWEYQKGYIWGVYVDSAYRRQGIATELMQHAMAYLKEIGCTKALLHASDEGKKLYASLGYQESNEMVFGLDSRSDKLAIS
ncbi:MAG: GNAT family N-acetyltransferase [Cyanobacteriota bacterium]|nr:GNAT family N-acetyltransferase [Cyanobacteriota bacterium]